MDTKNRHFPGRTLASLALAGLLCAGPTWPVPEAAAGLPAPLPTQIPIRDIGEPPSPSQTARPFVPAPPRKPRRHKTVRHRRPGAPPVAKTQTSPPAQAHGNQSGPRLEQRQEPPIESIMGLEPLPAPAPTPPPAGPKPTPTPAPAPASQSGQVKKPVTP